MNTLGIHKPASQTRIVVAMSGGVDSSVVAAMLHEEGYEVIGVTLQLYDHAAAIQKKGACCAGQDIHDARRVAESLGIPHYVLNYESKFREAVMNDFMDTYLAGQTPVPCVRCNQSVKFRDLLATARDLGADAMATGHYVQRRVESGRAQLLRGADSKKDQSYFLFATTQQQLDFLRFPLGDRTKEQTRRLAARYGLAVSDKPDSQDICFVPEGGYARVIEKLRPGACDPGEIIDLGGEVLGRHQGIIHYTVGQRRGLLDGQAEPLYVIRLDAEKNQVVVGPRPALATSRMRLRDVNWLDSDLPQAGGEVEIRWRSSQPLRPALLRGLPDGGMEVELIQPEEGVAPGQACVAYLGERVLGGGWIAATERAGA